MASEDVCYSHHGEDKGQSTQEGGNGRNLGDGAEGVGDGSGTDGDEEEGEEEDEEFAGVKVQTQHEVGDDREEKNGENSLGNEICHHLRQEED